MSKNVDSITRALKLKAAPKQNALTFRLGTKKLTLPFEVRTLQSDGFVFLHIPPAAGILKVTGEGLELVENDDEAVAAQASFRKPRAKRAVRRAPKTVELPNELMSALNKIPAGHKLVFDANGAPRLVKMRTRRKS